jgi:TRAP transporter TAXI family solute receptor
MMEMISMTKVTAYAAAIAGLLALTAPACLAAGAQDQSDPGKVSEGLRAIFNYGNATAKIKDRLNANTVTVITGTIGGTYVQIGADLASVLDDGDRLRILPIVGRGSVQSIADILFLKGVDLGVIRSDTLDYLERKGYATNLKSQFTYVTKLYNEEMHVVAPRSVRSLSDLEGKTVSVDLPNGGTFVTAMTVFERLGIRPNYVFIEQRIAYEKLRKGEIDALVAVQGAPSKLITQIKDEKLHFVPIDYAKPLQDDYLPAQLKAEDYPSLLAPGERIDTIAVPAVLAAYNWPQKSERYRKVAHFVEAFFSKFKEFQQPPFHPKWREIAPQAPLKGWTRFPAAQALLDGAAPTTELRERFDRFVVEGGPKAAGASAKSTDDALFNEFVKWKKRGRTSVTKPAAE